MNIERRKKRRGKFEEIDNQIIETNVTDANVILLTDLSGLRLLINDSKIDLCVGFFSTSRPDKPISGCGVAINSEGSILVSADIVFKKPY